MSALPGPGAIRIGVGTDAGGHVTSVTLMSSRPVGLGRLFVGKRATEAPALASLLFSLCGFSHGAASRLALAAACGRAMTPSERFSTAIGLAAEHIAECLRSTALGWPRVDGAEEAARAAGPLRDALSAARPVLAVGARGEAYDRRGELVSPAETLLGAAEDLGWRRETPKAPAPGSVLAAVIKEATAEDFLKPKAPDALLPADDAAVIDSLRRGREGFAAAPALACRIVETGAFARCWRETASGGSAIAARLAARFLALTEAAEELRRLLGGDGESAGEVFSAAGAGGEGYAAIETARGRLYHLVRVDADERICDYQIVAPTAWNFHPAGPFVAALHGAGVGGGEAARLRIRRLATVFDPCVPFQLDLREDSHA